VAGDRLITQRGWESEMMISRFERARSAHPQDGLEVVASVVLPPDRRDAGPAGTRLALPPVCR
jgi:hypothetical protein